MQLISSHTRTGCLPILMHCYSVWASERSGATPCSSSFPLLLVTLTAGLDVSAALALAAAALATVMPREAGCRMHSDVRPMLSERSSLLAWPPESATPTSLHVCLILHLEEGTPPPVVLVSLAVCCSSSLLRLAAERDLDATGC